VLSAPAFKVHLNDGVTITGHDTWTCSPLELALVENKEVYMDTGYKVDLSWVKGTCRKVVSEAIQKKAFDLGYKWCMGGGLQLTDKPHLFFERGKYITQTDDADWFNRAPEKEVSVNNWLEGKLPQPEKPKYMPKDGDAVLVRTSLDRVWASGISKGYITDGKYTMYDGYSYAYCIPFNKKLFGTWGVE